MTGPLVGFDLDMTLIDTRPGFAACLRALGEEVGVAFDVETLVERLGPPLDHLLAPYFPDAGPGELDGLVDRFRALYPALAVPATAPMPGAHEALRAVREAGGRSAVVTGKYRPNAVLHVDALGFDVAAVVGEVWGTGKGPALRDLGAVAFVGDHVHDVEGAHAAGIPAVGVTTGGCTADELRDAGAHLVVDSLHAVVAWVRERAGTCWWQRPDHPVG